MVDQFKHHKDSGVNSMEGSRKGPINKKLKDFRKIFEEY